MAEDHQLRLLVDPSTFDCLNMGDVAMLQVAVARLRAMWPDATIQVLTNDPDALAIHCPGVEPVDNKGRRVWFGDKDLLGRIHKYLPKAASDGLTALKRALRNRWPSLLLAIIRSKSRFQRGDASDPQAFLTAVRDADVLVVSGAGTITDSQRGHANLVLNTLEWALRRDLPSVMFGQGIGPLEDPQLLTRATAILPSVQYVTTREGRAGPQLLESMGLSPDQVAVTGDEAIELAYGGRASGPGNALGINLRVAHYADVDTSFVDVVRPVLRSFAEGKGAPLLPVPITIRPTYDPLTLRQLLAGYDDLSDGGESLNTPMKVIEQAGRCRIVVAGAYHAAVFALAQGIPTVCLARSRYYIDKFLGLQELFGTGCQVVMLTDSDFAENLTDAMEKAWSMADEVRSPLYQAAARQCEMSATAYRHFGDLMRSWNAGDVLQPSHQSDPQPYRSNTSAQL